MPVPCRGMGGVLYAMVLYGNSGMLAEISVTRIFAMCVTELVRLDKVLGTRKTNDETSGLLVFNVLNGGVATLAEPILV